MQTPPRGYENNARFTEHFGVSPPYELHAAGHQNDPPLTPEYDTSPDGLQHRLSDKIRSSMPPSSPFPGSVPGTDAEKEVAYPAPQPLPYRRPEDRQYRSRARICCMPAKLFWLLLLLLVLLAIGLGVGLGVGLGSKRNGSNSTNTKPSSTSQYAPYAIGGAIDPAYYSTQGAFNGSGIALASQSFSRQLTEGTQGTLVMYFQHYSGEIRWEQLSAGGQWLGGSKSEVVASDARNSTPLSAVSYVLNGSSTWHLFYIDKNNNIKQRTNSNTTNVWVDGPLNLHNVTALDNNTVGMQACWYGSDYGDSDYAHTPVPGTGSNGSTSEYGMHLWYASDETTFQQLGWRAGEKEWRFQQSWTNLNGHAGVGCYSWGPGTVTYVMFVDLNNTVNFYWKDTNTNTTSTDKHPINKWTNSSISIPNVHPATSLGYTNFFYAQKADTGLINGYNITWGAENTSFVSNEAFAVQGARPLGGSHMSVTAIPNTSGGNNLLVFCQTNGSDITAFTRDWIAGQWTSAPLQIPQS